MTYCFSMELERVTESGCLLSIPDLSIPPDDVIIVAFTQQKDSSEFTSTTNYKIIQTDKETYIEIKEKKLYCITVTFSRNGIEMKAFIGDINDKGLLCGNVENSFH